IFGRGRGFYDLGQGTDRAVRDARAPAFGFLHPAADPDSIRTEYLRRRCRPDELPAIPGEYVRVPVLPVQRFAQLSAASRSGGDFPSSHETLYWDPLLATDVNGRASLRFAAGPGVRSYRLVIDAYGDGR